MTRRMDSIGRFHYNAAANTAKLLTKTEVQQLSFRRSIVDRCKAGLYSRGPVLIFKIGHKGRALADGGTG